jgi:hypothetical protein
MIPKIIHYCWLSDNPYPEKTVLCINSWRKYLPDYKLMRWDKSLFDIYSIQWVKEAYEIKKYAFAADYIRLFAVYNYGGIYLDTDIEVIRPFNGLLNNDCMFAYEDDKTKLIEAGCFGAKKGFWFIKKCLDYYNNRSFIKGDKVYDMLPIPQIMKSLYDEPSNEKINFYPSWYFTAKSHITGRITISENTYCIHHFLGSWLTNGERRYYKFRGFICKYAGKNLGLIICFPVLFIFFMYNYGLIGGLQRLAYKVSFCSQWGHFSKNNKSIFLK